MIMLNKVLGHLAGIGLLLSTTSATAQMPMEHSQPAPPFRRIDQPIALKLGVTAGGLALMGLELWWFLYSKQKSQKADSTGQGIQEVTITVDGGYEPSQIVVNAGQPVRLNFFRRDPSNCLEQVRFPDFGIAQDLKLNQTTPIEFTPSAPGKYSFACGMNMFHGVVEAISAERNSRGTATSDAARIALTPNPSPASEGS
ncbi:MAG: cupredoxin domain-containing protein [Myxacorys californica WJT36-NPBG1]|jgi:plastocyanin domain-containing protein|nr:cupredoxin domain-containing protein [Myxacorys californica WJT36-NPBG1]